MLSSLPFDEYVPGVIKYIAARSVLDLPPEAWWVPALVFLILVAAAAIDAIKAIVPDALIFVGLLALTALQGLYVSWPFAGEHLRLAVIAGLSLWAINHLWFLAFKHDALGMGDAKWTMLAIACFGLSPVVFAWGFGACLAVLWMGSLSLVRYKITRVYFAPFLLLGLMAGIYWLRLKNFSVSFTF
ncbi:MAG: prepilin peptidase [Alphaproteobacteria bacterium]|nr:prepilin peptidase [Alphaproteobacteria bacterium]